MLITLAKAGPIQTPRELSCDADNLDIANGWFGSVVLCVGRLSPCVPEKNWNMEIYEFLGPGGSFCFFLFAGELRHKYQDVITIARETLNENLSKGNLKATIPLCL